MPAEPVSYRETPHNAEFFVSETVSNACFFMCGKIGMENCHTYYNQNLFSSIGVPI